MPRAVQAVPAGYRASKPLLSGRAQVLLGVPKGVQGGRAAVPLLQDKDEERAVREEGRRPWRCRKACRRINGAVRRGPRLYKDGRKYCHTCARSFRQRGNRCPCCRAQLRAGPRQDRGRGRAAATPRL